MDPPGYENINQINEFHFLATPTRPVQPIDKLYLRRNGEMIYLGTYSEARSRSEDRAGHYGIDINVIGRDGTDYGSFESPSINENLFIKLPQHSLPISIPRQRNPSRLQTLSFMSLPSQDLETYLNETKSNLVFGSHHSKITYPNQSNPNAGNFKSKKSHRKRSHRRKSYHKKPHRRKSHHKKPHRRKSFRNR
jgi:hypothetical protein